MDGITPHGLTFDDADIAAIEHDCDFDPTCGYSIAELCALQPDLEAPADFADFWRETYERAMLGSSVTALAPSFEEALSPLPGVRCWHVSYNAFGCVRVHGDLYEPEDGPTRGLVVHGHGYGGPGGEAPGWATRGYASLQVHQRGFGRSEVAGLPHGMAMRHVIHHITDRENYVIRGCVAEIWQAGSLLIHRHPALQAKLFYFGGSFGGGIGTLALPWDTRFKGGAMRVPTFGNHPIRLAHKCRGSGEAVRLHSKRKPELLDTLPYYDAAIAARHITVPVHYGIASFDPAVIPPGQFSVANACTSPGSRAVMLPADHFDPPETLWSPTQRQAYFDDQDAFIDAIADGIK